MKRSVHRFSLCGMFLLTLSGCGRVVDWAKETFYQGEKIDTQVEHAHRYVRSARLYDQLATCAAFDALWLSDEVRHMYADMYIHRRGKGEENLKAVIRRQLEENNHYISFYVLTLDSILLGDNLAEWKLFLSIDGIEFSPIEIKWAELSPEHRHMFGKAWNRFKTPYLVRFNAKDTEDRFLIGPETGVVTLHMRSVDKQVCLSWPLNDGHVVGE